MEEELELYDRKVEILKALAHPVRLRIVYGLLKNGCHNVGCMEAGIGQSQSCISQHLSRLKAAGIVKCSRQGNEVYYEVASGSGVAGVIEALFAGGEEER